MEQRFPNHITLLIMNQKITKLRRFPNQTIILIINPKITEDQKFSNQISIITINRKCTQIKDFTITFLFLPSTQELQSTQNTKIISYYKPQIYRTSNQTPSSSPIQRFSNQIPIHIINKKIQIVQRFPY